LFLGFNAPATQADQTYGEGGGQVPPGQKINSFKFVKTHGVQIKHSSYKSDKTDGRSLIVKIDGSDNTIRDGPERRPVPL
jgi:hypothetical protein